MGNSTAAGILPDDQIAALFDGGNVLSPSPRDPDQIQPASLDLRLGPVAYRVRASFLPGPTLSVEERMEPLKLHALDLTSAAVLEPGRVYIAPLQESLALPSDLAAATNPKSSTGRLDIFTRVITDRAREFDTVAAGFRGPLDLALSPRPFPIVARAGSRRAQIRFRRGAARLDDAALEALHAETPLVDGVPSIGNGVMLSIDLAGSGNGVIGYRAKRHTGLIDIDRRDAYDVLDYWDPIASRGRPELILDPDQFYILVSREAVHVPPDYAAEMVPFDPLVGEFRVHYAGFFDPGFGHSPAGGPGPGSPGSPSVRW